MNLKCLIGGELEAQLRNNISKLKHKKCLIYLIV